MDKTNKQRRRDFIGQSFMDFMDAQQYDEYMKEERELYRECRKIHEKYGPPMHYTLVKQSADDWEQLN